MNMSDVLMRNWKGSITYRAHTVEAVERVDDIIRIVKDRRTYPDPVRVRGSHHSTTRCLVAEQGTVIDMRRMNRILEIDPVGKRIRMEAGVLHIDAAKELEKHGLQFYVNCEIGNMTVGSGACGGTKDASYIASDGTWEYGQVASYVVGMKAVQADGTILEVTEDDGELLEVMRSSYGMLGVIFEVTFKVRGLEAMVVEHVHYDVDDFAARLDEILAQQRSVMLYLFPFLDSVVVEYRYPGAGSGPPASGAWQWRVRNVTWKTLWPAIGRILTTTVPAKRFRSWLLDRLNRVTQIVMTALIRRRATSPTDQIIRYPETAGFAAYTFSIWAFPRSEYANAIKAYYKFCRNYFNEHRYRCDLMNVGYHIAQDQQSLFSYTRDWPALTLDPVSTGSDGWEEFLDAYNEFCIAHNAKPLFNQSPRLKPEQAQAAFGSQIQTFLAYRQRFDPDQRFYTAYFRELFEPS